MIKWRAIVTVIVSLAIIGGALIFTIQQHEPSQTSSQTPATTPMSTTTQTITSIPNPPSAPTPSPTPTTAQSAVEEARIRDVVKAYYAAFSRRSEETVAGFFVEDGQKLLNNGKDGSFAGRNEIRSGLARGFSYCNDVTIRELNITKVQIDGDKATIQAKYEQHSNLCPTLDITENMQLVKIADAWKIAKTNLEFIPAKD